VVDKSGYREWLSESNSEEDQQHSNIEELLTVARQFDERRSGTLEEFLEEMCLVNDTDDWTRRPIA
jgi:superfamily I DNA/RNA helicase